MSDVDSVSYYQILTLVATVTVAIAGWIWVLFGKVWGSASQKTALQDRVDNLEQSFVGHSNWRENMVREHVQLTVKAARLFERVTALERALYGRRAEDPPLD